MVYLRNKNFASVIIRENFLMDTQLRCQQNYEKVTIKDFSSLLELNDTRS